MSKMQAFAVTTDRYNNVRQETGALLNQICSNITESRG